MATTKYGMDTPDYSTTGWNAMVKSGFEKMDLYLHTWRIVTLDEDVDEGDALYLQINEKWIKGIADDTHRPVQGIATEDGVADGTIKMQMVGPITYSGWTLVAGKGVWLSDSVWGGVTQTKPSNHAQLLGIALSTTTINLNIQLEADLLPASTTTTTTTTSSSTTTTTA